MAEIFDTRTAGVDENQNAHNNSNLARLTKHSIVVLAVTIASAGIYYYFDPGRSTEPRSFEKLMVVRKKISHIELIGGTSILPMLDQRNGKILEEDSSREGHIELIEVPTSEKQHPGLVSKEVVASDEQLHAVTRKKTDRDVSIQADPGDPDPAKIIDYIIQKRATEF